MSTSRSLQPYEQEQRRSEWVRTGVLSPARTMARFWPYWLSVAALCCTRIGGLTHQSLWFDEGYTLGLSSAQSVQEFLKRFAESTTSEHLQPLFYFLMYGWSRIAGTSDFALRLPSALASIIAGLLVYSATSRLATARKQAVPLIVTAGYCVSSYSVSSAQDARPYGLIQCLAFAVLAMWIQRRTRAEERYVQRQRRQTVLLNEVLFMAVVASACLTSIFNVVLVASLVLGDGFYAKSLREWRRRWMAPVCIATSTIALYGVMAWKYFPTFVAHDIVSIKQPLWMNAGYTFYGLAFGAALAPADTLLRSASKLHVVLAAWRLLLPSTVALLLLGAAILRLSRRLKRMSKLALTLMTCAAIYCVIFFAGFGLMGHLNILPRHASALFALLFVTGAVFLVRADAYAIDGRITAMLLTSSLIAVGLCNVISLYRYASDPDVRKDDYRAVSENIPNDGLRAYVVEGQPSLFQHYGLTTIPADDVKPRELEIYLRRVAGDLPVRLIVNENRGYLWDGKSSPIEAIAKEYSCSQEQSRPHMDVERCVPRASVLAEIHDGQ